MDVLCANAWVYNVPVYILVSEGESVHQSMQPNVDIFSSVTEKLKFCVKKNTFKY